MTVTEIKELMKEHEEAALSKDLKLEALLLVDLLYISEEQPNEYKQAWKEF